MPNILKDALTLADHLFIEPLGHLPRIKQMYSLPMHLSHELTLGI